MTEVHSSQLPSNWHTSMTEVFFSSLEDRSSTLGNSTTFNNSNRNINNNNNTMDSINIDNSNDNNNDSNNNNNANHDASLLAQSQPEELQTTEEVLLPCSAARFADNEEEADGVCGVCLERPEPGNYVEVLCCGNVLCVNDAQQLGKCPFCRVEPLAWSIEM